ncbi:P-loop containing nucleoside triphosphate hydrolase protein [Ostreococcus tauri]|uniref:Kinesin-like protein n=1 Tax=Ostreococcus tauri TaxID=70448 RepID=A0A1Y5IFU6_OSTTA|nr:P-loop containing nucleoside triphosphate hydrolase protein [Ostreococcus tauri]
MPDAIADPSASAIDDNKVFVAVRVRPLSASERERSKNAWDVVDDEIIVPRDGSSGTYVFDRAFGDGSDNKAVYDATTSRIVENVMKGFNGTVFAYGQTSSGKTHTMHGTADEPGVIPLAVRDVFDAVRRQGSDRDFFIRVSYLEIYNEKIMDLFAFEELSSDGDDDSTTKLSIREGKDGTYVSGLREEVVSMPSQVIALLERGTKLRHVGATNMNAHSSRSHTIFRMIIESKAIAGGTDGAGVLQSTLNLVDLAGSERMSKTGAEGERAKEGAHINKSLMTLGVVINKLSEGVESKGGHIPYRDSKLTRILQPALGGNSKTAIVCAMTPALSHCEESHSTLKFAQRAKRVVNKATVNEVAANAETNAMLKRQRKEIAVLRARLAEEGAKVDDAAIEALRRRLAEADREKNLVALALEDAETKTKEREAKIKELEAKLEELSEPHTEELDLNSTGPTGQSLSAVTPGTLQALRAFEAKVVALEKDRDAIKLKLEDDLERSEKRREELERSRLDAMGEIASLKEEIAEITTSLVDGDGASGDVQILLAQAKRARERAENELTGMKADFFEEKSRRAVAEAEVKRLGDKVTMILEEKSEASKGTNTEASVAHLALRKQVIKQSETIALLEARTKEADQMLDEAIRVYEDEVAKNKRLVEEFKSTGCIYDESERSAISLQDSKTLEALEEQRRANDELSKKCAILEKKYAVAKAAFAKLEKDQASAKQSTEDTAGGDSLKRENKDLKRQMHKLTEVYSRLREKFNAGEEAFDKAKGAMELKYDLQALERKRQLEKKAFMAKIQDLESSLAKERPATGKLGDSITPNSNKKARIATEPLRAADANVPCKSTL